MTQQQQMTLELVGDRELQVTREFNAPCALVFEAYSDCQHLMQWWGPRTFPLAYCDIDFRPGGTWHYCMKGPNGEEAWGLATYVDIERPSRIVYKDAFSDENRNEKPPISLITLTLEERGERTVLSMHARYDSPSDRDTVIEMGMEEGLAQTLDKLEEHLATR